MRFPLFMAIAALSSLSVFSLPAHAQSMTQWLSNFQSQMRNGLQEAGNCGAGDQASCDRLHRRNHMNEAMTNSFTVQQNTMNQIRQSDFEQQWFNRHRTAQQNAMSALFSGDADAASYWMREAEAYAPAYYDSNGLPRYFHR